MLPLLVALTGSGPCPALPLETGSSWTYRADVAWAAGDSAARRTILWTTTVLTVQASDSALAATVRGWPTDLAGWEPGAAPTLSVIYCAGGRVYEMHPATGTAAALARDLLAGSVRPGLDDLILDPPLKTGRLFGRDPAERKDTFYAWLVERAEAVPPSLRRLRPEVGDSLYSLVYQTNPDYTEIGFVPGLGVAHYVYSHHGTTAEADARLMGYGTGGSSRYGMLEDALLGVLTASRAVADTEAARRCISLPAAPRGDRIVGAHGDSLVATRCEVLAYGPLGPDSAAGWMVARYRWTSVFTAEDTTRPPAARDTVVEEEAVVFVPAGGGGARPVWHERFETGASAIWRSVTPEVASTAAGAGLLSVMSCVNGTGGCGQEFLRRYPDGRWAPVWQVWLDQLPAGFSGRILHGVRIDPRTLAGTAGFYGPRDPNCCPAEELRLRLALRGDSLALSRYAVVPSP